MSYNGLLPYHNPNMQNTGVLVKTGQAKVGALLITNSNASPRYLRLYDSAGAPVVGTTVPVMCIALPGALGPQWIPFKDAGQNEEEGGVRFVNGLGIACTTSYADTDTGNPSNGDVQVNLLYR